MRWTKATATRLALSQHNGVEAGCAIPNAKARAASRWINVRRANSVSIRYACTQAPASAASIQFGELGLRFAHIVDRLTLRGMIGAHWTRGDTHPSYTASFNAVPEVGFEIHGQHVPTGSARGSVGVEYRTASNMVWNIGLAGESGTGDVTNVSATGGLRITF